MSDPIKPMLPVQSGLRGRDSDEDQGQAAALWSPLLRRRAGLRERRQIERRQGERRRLERRSMERRSEERRAGAPRALERRRQERRQGERRLGDRRRTERRRPGDDPPTSGGSGVSRRLIGRKRRGFIDEYA
ncbi:hypothetical protein L0E83_05665 [Marichromatium gracile]|uniref:Uncharacterized protein n=1 Tax=Marichromatium gracile TaxID=1048 RepID=A0A4R4A695_MARGR|nr:MULTISPECIES: hypothetical protein [Marichromatium]MBO8086810.1 hypothetical protein [Marichromatium sp.]MBK1708136.1 hypothetical protein [Marichromatium gracile]MCF1182927.1 hypothetical protein [Marichromatium gracile]RNE89628.1 hypothetical protein EBL84_10660 [Marichromatium sp. AB31]RNE94707.1 hypothetical protein EBL85_00760 [Marichromatium sp. AB32]